MQWDPKFGTIENNRWEPKQILHTSRQPRKLIFGVQPYFDPARKMNSTKKGKKTSKTEKKKDDNLIFCVKNQNDDLQKNGRRPQKKSGRRPQQKMEDDLQQKWKTTSIFL